jgi:hypothetical protein
MRHLRTAAGLALAIPFSPGQIFQHNGSSYQENLAKCNIIRQVAMYMRTQKGRVWAVCWLTVNVAPYEQLNFLHESKPKLLNFSQLGHLTYAKRVI